MVRKRPISCALCTTVLLVAIGVFWSVIDREIRHAKVVGVWRPTHYDLREGPITVPDFYAPGVNDKTWATDFPLHPDPAHREPHFCFYPNGVLEKRSNYVTLSPYSGSTSCVEWCYKNGSIFVTNAPPREPWYHRLFQTTKRRLARPASIQAQPAMLSPPTVLTIYDLNGVCVIECVLGISTGQRVLLTRGGDDNTALDELTDLARLPTARRP